MTDGVCASWRQALRDASITHLVGLADSVTAPLFTPATVPPSPPEPHIVLVCREGEAVALAAGLWAGGARPLIWIQSTGLFTAGDVLRSVTAELAVPLDLVVGWRGQSGKLNAGYPDTARDWLEPTLFAWRLNYQIARSPAAPELAEWLQRGAGRERDARVLVIPQ